MRYIFISEDNLSIRAEHEDGTSIAFGWESGSSAWKEFVRSGQTPEPYVAPLAPPEPTDTEKLESATNLTVAEIKGVLYSDLITRIEALEADHATLMNNNNGGY